MQPTGFRSLQVWQEGKALSVQIYRQTMAGDLARHHSLADQMRRAAISVPSNLAEGYERDKERESIRFFQIAKGSLAELATQLEIAVELQIVKGEPGIQLIGEINLLSRRVGALIMAREKRLTASPRTQNPASRTSP